MRLVETWTEIRGNLIAFNSYGKSSDMLEREFFVERLRLGKCFVALDTDKGIIFGPSRFLGYVDNNIYSHEDNKSKHGWDTNPAISEFVGPCKTIAEIEESFIRFCHEYQVDPIKYTRKYWCINKERDFLSK